jgi:hypothetical protein
MIMCGGGGGSGRPEEAAGCMEIVLTFKILYL